MCWVRNLELLKTEHRETVSGLLGCYLSQTKSGSAYGVPESCLVVSSGTLLEVQGLFLQSLFLLVREPFLTSRVNLHCVYETVACCYFHRGFEEQGLSSSLQQIPKCLKSITLALLSHCFFWSDQQESRSALAGDLLRHGPRSHFQWWGFSLGQQEEICCLVLCTAEPLVLLCLLCMTFKITISVLNQQPVPHQNAQNTSHQVLT